MASFVEQTIDTFSSLFSATSDYILTFPYLNNFPLELAPLRLRILRVSASTARCPLLIRTPGLGGVNEDTTPKGKTQPPAGDHLNIAADEPRACVNVFFLLLLSLISQLFLYPLPSIN